MSEINNFHIIVACYYLDPSEIKRKLDFAKKLGCCEIIVVVNNPKYFNQINFQNVVQGSNDILDFSAYREGLAHVKKIDIDCNKIILFINDSLLVKHPYKYIINKIASDFEYKSAKQAMAYSFSGKYNFYFDKNPWENTQLHLCGAAFALNLHGLKIFETLYDCVRAETINVKSHEQLESLYGKNFYNFINVILIENNRVWKPINYTAISNVDYLKKSLAFYFEHKLTANLIKNNAGIIYINRYNHEYVLIFKTIVNKIFRKLKFL